jgi:hypothetical protein
MGAPDACVRCTGVSHVSFSNLACQSLTATCKTQDALQIHTGLKLREVCKYSGSPDAEHRTVRCSLDSYPERFAKPRGHLSQNTARSNLRPVPGVQCSTLAEPGSLYTGRTGTTSGAFGPASGECFLARNIPATSPNFFHRRKRKYTLNFLKKF